MANEYKIQLDKLYNKNYLKVGLAVYYGALLPSEKIFIECIFEKRLIDTIIGTDALALGVNFPVENVIFTQLEKGYEYCISKNLFDQLSGRAGRKGYYDKGYVYYCDFFYDTEDNSNNIAKLYNELLLAKNENTNLKLTPIISNILKGLTTVKEEINYIIENSTNYNNEKELRQNIYDALTFIRNYHIVKEKRDEFHQNIKNVYFDEFDVHQNCYFFECILLNKTVKEMILGKNYDFNTLLQLRKYLKKLPKKYRKKSYILEIEKLINDIDSTVLNVKFLNKFI